MSVRSGDLSTQRTISKPVLQESLKAEQSKEPVAAPRAGTMQLADKLTPAKKDPSSPANAAACASAPTPQTVTRSAQKVSQANPMAGLAAAQIQLAEKDLAANRSIDEAVKGAKGDNPRNPPAGGPTPNLPGKGAGSKGGTTTGGNTSAEGSSGGRGSSDPSVGGGSNGEGGQGKGTLKESSALLPDMTSAARAALKELTVLSESTAQPGFDQGFEGKPAGDQLGKGPISINPISSMTSTGIGGPLGEAAASDVKGAPDNRSLIASTKETLEKGVAAAGLIMIAAGLGPYATALGAGYAVGQFLDLATDGALSSAGIAGPNEDTKLDLMWEAASEAARRTEAEKKKADDEKKAEEAKQAEDSKKPKKLGVVHVTHTVTEGNGKPVDDKSDAKAAAEAERKEAEARRKAEEEAKKKAEQEKKTGTPVPEGEGRKPDRFNLVGGSLAIQRQKAAKESGQQGSEVMPSPEDNPAVRSSGAVLPSASQIQHSLVGMPVGSAFREGGAPGSGPDYGGDAGAIDLGPDAVNSTAGGISENPEDVFSSEARRDLPPESDDDEDSDSSESGGSSGSSSSSNASQSSSTSS